MVPAVIPLLLLLIPTMLTALSVVRENRHLLPDHLAPRLLEGPTRRPAFIPLLLAGPVLLGLGVALLKKQDS